MKINRPLSPHLSVYQPQLTSILSIFHRISGGFLATFFLFSIWCIQFCELNLTFFPVYNYFFSMTTQFNWLVISLFNLALVAFCYHVTNGIRHLLWDFGFFLDLSKVYATGTITIFFSFLLFLLIQIVRIFF